MTKKIIEQNSDNSLTAPMTVFDLASDEGS